jgi:hypothetical protein
VSLGLEFAFAEVDLLLAAGTGMLLIELVGEDFLFLAAVGALADKGGQLFVGLETGAMTRCAH